jgi:Family of unknown function (DUF6130)
MRGALMISTLAMAIVAAACGGSDDPPAPTGATGGDRPSSTGTVTIVSPANGDVIEGTRVDLRVELDDARIVPQTTREISPDEGHLHVYLDGSLISMTEGTEQEVTDLTPGPHRIQVEFVAADHAPFDPRVVTIAAFQVRV